MAIDGQISAQIVWDAVQAITSPTKFDPTKLDIPFCQKVLDFAKGEHKDFTFNMHYWHIDTRQIFGAAESACGTTACLAGTAVHLSPEAEIVEKLGKNDPMIMVGCDEDYGRYIEIDGQPYSWSGAGAKLMGLDPTTAHRLFVLTAQNGMGPGDAESQALTMLESLIKAAEKAQYGGE